MDCMRFVITIIAGQVILAVILLAILIINPGKKGGKQR